MKTRILNGILLFLAIGFLFANWALSVNPRKRNFEVLPDMAVSVPYDSFSSNPNFADGKTLQEPPRGVIVRGMMPLHYTATPADAIRAGVELKNPVAGVKAATARGAIVFANFCEVCHGPAGKGDGPVAKRGFPAPPSLLAPHAMGLPDGHIFHIVTYGQNTMPSYASQISREDRWAVIDYVRTLQGVARPATPAESVGDPKLNGESASRAHPAAVPSGGKSVVDGKRRQAAALQKRSAL